MKALWFLVILVILAIFLLGFLGGSLTYKHSGPNISHIAPIYALDSCTVDTSHVGATGVCYPNAGDFPNFWQEATKNTQFTIDGKPVEITDVQVFYKETTNNIQWYHHTTIEDWLSFIKNHPNITWDSNAWTGLDGNWIAYTEPTVTYGNITYYPSGIENSQTYVAPMPTPTPILAFPDMCSEGCLICEHGMRDCTYIHGRPSPTPTPSPVFAFP